MDDYFTFRSLEYRPTLQWGRDAYLLGGADIGRVQSANLHTADGGGDRSALDSVNRNILGWHAGIGIRLRTDGGSVFSLEFLGTRMTTDAFKHWPGSFRSGAVRLGYAHGSSYRLLDLAESRPGAPPDTTLDSDHDGVPDHRDRQPNTPFGAEADAYGVAGDDDGDGVPNGIDLENNTPRGAEVDMYGVSRDDDGDGVPNGIDQDNSTPPGSLVDQFGRMVDADHDGVDDPRDKCPKTPADLVVDASGCPQLAKTRVTQMLDKGRVQETRIYFETGKAALLAESYPVLDTIGVTLSQFPSLIVQVGGHCDDRGTDALNQRLSEDRARAVVTYLLSKNPGLTSDRLTSKGFGRKQPVTAGTDEESRRRNRRVEFLVLNLGDVGVQKELQDYIRR